MKKTLNKVVEILNAQNIDEANVKARIILREIANMTVEDMLLDREVKNEDEVLSFAQKLAQTKMPIQQLLGFGYFMGEKFKVTPDTLIPRDETEILVKCALDKVKELQKDETKPLSVLDIGAGTGAIACSIAKNSQNVEVLGVDISSNALMVALENAQKLDLIKRVVYRKSDIFSALREGEVFDIVVSNPPYISEKDYKNLDTTVKDFEPKIALLAKNDGYEFYEKIISQAKKYVKYGGYILFECGQNQAQKICMMLERNGFQVSDVVRDLAGIERVVAAQMIFIEEDELTFQASEKIS